MTTPEPLVLAVVHLSDSFATAWPDLAEELGVRYSAVEPSAVPASGAVAVILAAGGEEQGALDLLASGVPRSPDVPLYLVGALASHRFAAEAVRRGASDYFALPGDLDLLGRTLELRVQTARQKARRSGETRRPAEAFHELLGASPALRHVLDLAGRVLKHGDVTVLVSGETGTGKELLARALHDGGARAPGPFVAINCAAIPANLLEAELFGHERGAFTDAHQSKPGLFEEADGGTLFLDEVGHLPLALQGKLLRALDDQKIRRLGATQSRAVDVRIIAATNVDLAEAVRRGTFREDLFYRLNVVGLTLPPLREREGDVDLLADAFASSLAARYGVPVPTVTPAVRAALRAHDWPGNVRELRHAIERALLLSEPGTLDPAQLTPAAPTPGPTEEASPSLTDIIGVAVTAVLAECGGNRTLAARRLGISRQRLQRIVEKADGDRV